jgi:hypothetical protein
MAGRLGYEGRMLFAKRLREGVREGRITCSVRIWTRPKVKVGGAYRMENGHIVVESIRPIALGDVDGDLARRCGFDGVVDLLKVARHGSGRNGYLIGFRYVAGGGPRGDILHPV